MKTIYHLTHCAVAISSLLFLSGCESTTQTTSGREYLNKYEQAPQTGENTASEQGNLDAEVRRIANIEPLLKFPARIGIAKIYNGQLSNLTGTEAEAWNNTRAELGKDFGEFVPVSPMIAEMVYSPHSGNTRTSEIVRKIRLGAARQHLDAVLIYEVFSETEELTLPSAVAAWTIIGAYFVPSDQSTTIAFSNALLVDVRNGYPYGTASASAKKVDLTTMVAERGQVRRQQDDAQDAAALKLMPEIVDMFRNLQAELN
ncbi:MAG: hypothetical protein ACSHX8_02765 [Opitutaceae bacterium]